MESAHEQDKKPPFQTVATAPAFFSDAEIDRLIAEHEPLLTEGKLGTGDQNSAVRRSRIFFFKAESKYQWLYQRLWGAAQECNRLAFSVDISGIEANVQLARYDSTDQGFYDWHTDFSSLRPLRKISVSVQLSRPEDYEGGDLELMAGSHPQKQEKARGAFIAFPSFVLHRVTPVTRGTRWSLVAWIVGTRWR